MNDEQPAASGPGDGGATAATPPAATPPVQPAPAEHPEYATPEAQSAQPQPAQPQPAQQPIQQPAAQPLQPPAPAASAWEAGSGVGLATAPVLPGAWGNPLGGLVAGLGGLAATYLTAFLLTLLAMVAGSLMDDGTEIPLGSMGDVELGSLFDAFGKVLQGIAQLVAMSLLGTLHLGIGEGMGNVEITLPVVLLTAVFTAATYALARRLVPRFPVGTQSGNVVLSLLGALGTAIVMLCITRLAGFDLTDDTISTTVHAASFRGFAVCFLLAFGAILLGRSHGAGRAVLGLHPLAREAVRAIKTFGYHLALFSLLFALVTVIFVLVKVAPDGGLGQAVGAVLLLPWLSGHLSLLGFGLASMGGVRIAGAGDFDFLDGRISRTFTLFDGPWYGWLGALLIGLACIALAGLFWASRRRVGRVNQQAELASWLLLPCAYLLGGLAMMVFARAGGVMSIPGDDSGTGSLALSAWTPLAIAVVGLLVDLAARYLAPVLLPLVPRQLFWWGPERTMSAAPLGRPAAQPGMVPGGVAPAPAAFAAPDAATAAPGLAGAALLGAGAAAQPAAEPEHTLVMPGAIPVEAQPFQTQSVQPQPVQPGEAQPGSGATAAPAPGLAQAPVGMPEAQPLSPEAKRRLKLAGIIAAAVLVLLIGAAIVVGQLNKTVFGPEAVAGKVLADLSSGDADGALDKLGAAAPAGNQELLTSKLYSGVENRVTDYTISDVEVDHDVAVAQAMTRHDSGAEPVQVSLVRDGKKFGLFDNWEVSALPVSNIALSLQEGINRVQVNGKELDVTNLRGQGQGVVIPAFPGNYQVKVPDQGKYFTGSEQKVPVTWTQPTESTSMKVSLNQQFTTDVEAAVKQKIDECAASTSLKVDESCPFEGPYFVESSSASWKVDSYPKISVGEASYDGSGYQVRTEQAGQVTATYRPSTSFGGEQPKLETTAERVQPSGIAKVNGDAVEVTLS